MRHSFPKLPAVLLLVLLAAGQPAAAQETQPSGKLPTGNEVVAAAARQVQALDGLSADLRCRIEAFGHSLAGQGSYQQLGAGPEKLLRMELKVQADDQALTRLEVCGPTYCYIRQESPLHKTPLARVNLRTLRYAISRSPEPIAKSPAQAWIQLGGLPRLLDSLEQNFAFAAPRGDELKFVTADGQSVEKLPVIVIKGTWKEDKLESLSSAKGKRSESTQIPGRVELILGRANQRPALFPYRITYFAAPSGKAEDAGEPEQVLFMLELFNVQLRRDLDPAAFEYLPGDQEVADLTGTYLERLGLKTK
ncbi:MAG: hypothetical protein MUF06_19845 [Pirellulaceae bacterium]|jgi:hypothetical protein|nr:hypothetical protein [Pirellulaceae bacterium]